MNYEQTRDALGLTNPPEVEFACLYLDRRGKQFCVDFRSSDAIAKAAIETCKELESQFEPPVTRPWNGTLGI